MQKAAADLYYSADRRTDAELCLLRLCDESLCGDLTALENRITRLEDAAARGAAISAAVNQRVSAAKAIGAAPVSQAPAKPASKPVEPPPAEAPPPWDESAPAAPPQREAPPAPAQEVPAAQPQPEPKPEYTADPALNKPRKVAAEGINPFPQWAEVIKLLQEQDPMLYTCLLYTSPSPRD